MDGWMDGWIVYFILSMKKYVVCGMFAFFLFYVILVFHMFDNGYI